LAALVLAAGSREQGATGAEPPAALAFRTELVIDNGTDDWFDTTNRAQVITAYRREFRNPDPELDWEGDHDRCQPGTSSPLSRLASIRRINYYRAMAGVPATITEDPELTAQAREAAIMMSVEGALSHDPEPSYACFTATGQQAAANSNLYLGRIGPEAIDGYIEDPGAGNVDVGHRNTILHPPTREMGVGEVGASETGYAANALWVFDDHVFDETSADRPPVRQSERFVAWPPEGYVPNPIVYPRWSFMLAGADFANADVSLYRMGSRSAVAVPVEVVARIGNPGHVPLPTIVWEPELDSDFATDETYLVIVSGVRGSDEARDPVPVAVDVAAQGPAGSSISSSYSYTVRIIGDRRLQAERPDPMVDLLARES
jgi:uncharacterized protein YkwD